MNKSSERLSIEGSILQAHEAALNTAMQMVRDEFGGDMGKAFCDQSFIERMRTRVQCLFCEYLEGYHTLEALERKEGFPAMRIYADALDVIGAQIPPKSRLCCYYPFSGIDFYWARIFRRLVCQDLGFNTSSTQNMWWDPEMYSENKREEIITLLKQQEIIPRTARLRCLRGDAERSRRSNDFNREGVTLLVKGGHDVVGFLKTRFGAKPLQFGAIVTVSAADPAELLKTYISSRGYEHTFLHPGTDWIAPYAMEIKDIHVFLKM